MLFLLSADFFFFQNQCLCEFLAGIQLGPEAITPFFSCSTQLSMKFQLFKKHTKILTNEEVSCFKPLR